VFFEGGGDGFLGSAKFFAAVCHEDKGTENLIATLRELQL
jgi:hypothetical protein